MIRGLRTRSMRIFSIRALREFHRILADDGSLFFPLRP